MPTRVRDVTFAVVAVTSLAAGCAYETADLSPEVPTDAASSLVLAADGTTLATLDSGERRREVAWDDLPRHLVDAVVAIEDRRFWLHPGVDLRAIARAARENVEAGEVVEGGSTITQQYVKNAFLGQDRTLDRKLEEASLAIQLERAHTKEEILTFYLNTVYLGAGAYGIGAAADTYFGKEIADVTVAEGALLAGLLRTPSADDPFVDAEAALERRAEVLEAMTEEGSLDAAGRDEALAEPIRLVAQDPDRRYRAPYFVEAVKRFVLDEPAFGETRPERVHRLYSGGLTIETTLDPTLQGRAEQAVDRVLVDPDDPDVAFVVIEPGTARVVALVGGHDFYDGGPSSKFDFATQGRRPAGSAFKPFALAAALEQGRSLNDVYDAPAHLDLAVAAGTWSVDNYDDVDGGRVDLVDATVFSFNTAYAQLSAEVGPTEVVETATRLGIASPLQAVPSVVLGSQEVSPFELASAYATLANEGRYVEPVTVTRVTDRDGAVLYEHRPTSVEAISPATASAVTHVLRQVVERGTGYRARIGRPAAGKTGTGQEWADAWFAGYTPDLAAVAWVGFGDGQIPMVPPTTRQTVAGGSWPAEIWQLFMTSALADVPVSDFAPPPIADDGALAPTGFGPVLPDVRGYPSDPGLESLVRAGFRPTVVEVPDDQYPRAVVVGTDPTGGLRAAAGSVVTVYVADGRPVPRVPGALDLDADEARDLLERAGYAVEVVDQADDDPVSADERPARSWRQEPSSGSPLPPGSTVTVWVNPAVPSDS